MTLKILWPGKTKNKELRRLQELYMERIRRMTPCQLIETQEAHGLEERYAEKIKEIEAQGLEKHFKDDYIVCLCDDGKEMSSQDFACFLDEWSLGFSRPLTFVSGGFLGFAPRILEKAEMNLSLSKMTFSHELSRIMLLEQIYRSLTMIQRKPYAK